MTPRCEETWIDERGDQHAFCVCGHDCSTHPDAAHPLATCGDCGIPTCDECRVADSALRCSDCAAKFYAAPAGVNADDCGREPMADVIDY